jgi:PAS domain S-box-containing protein
LQSAVQLRSGASQVTPFYVITLIASLIGITLGFFIYSFNRRALLNRLFLLVTVFGFLYSFAEVMMWASGSVADAIFWSKVGSIWPFFVVLSLHFALVFTGSNWLKRKITYFCLYGPAFLFWLIDLFTHWINLSPVLKYWGYDDPAAKTLIYGVSTVWLAFVVFLSFILCFRSYLDATDPVEKKQRQLFTIGFGIPIFTYIITNILLRLFGFGLPNLGHLAIMFSSVCIAIGILKYDLFTFNSKIVAEKIVSTIPDSFIIADLTGKIVKVNDCLMDFLGYSQAELIGTNMGRLCKVPKTCSDLLEELVQRRAMRNNELVFKTKFGEKRIVLFSGSVIQNRSGQDLGFTCILHDITERDVMEQRVVKAERLASIGELAGQIGHDLRNPLTGIKSAAYLLQKKGNKISDKQRATALEIIDNAVEDSNRIINSLVDYSSELYLNFEPCTPKSLLNQTLLTLKVPSRIIIIDKTEDVPELWLDAPKVEQAFANVIQNCIDAIPEQGTLEICSVANESIVTFIFSDSGVGIPESVLPKLFSPLTTTKAKGMGMGLAISKRIIDAHNGLITIESSQGKGTTLTITLPIKAKPENYSPILEAAFQRHPNELVTNAFYSANSLINEPAYDACLLVVAFKGFFYNCTHSKSFFICGLFGKKL